MFIKKRRENFKNKKSNFIWSIRNKVLHLHPLRDRRKVHRGNFGMILKRSVSSILTFLQEFEKDLALEFGCDRPGTNR